MPTEMPTEIPTSMPTEMPSNVPVQPLELESTSQQKEDKSMSKETTLGIIVGGVCFALMIIVALHKNRKAVNNETPMSPGTYFNKSALNNPVYEVEPINDDENGYIETNNYEEPVINTDSLKQKNLYETTDNEIMYDFATPQNENTYDFASNTNEFYDNLTN